MDVIVAALLVWGAAVAPLASPAAMATPVVYRIDLVGSAVVWSADRPQPAGALLVFHRHPDGLLMSVRTFDVRRLSMSKREPVAATTKKLAPGQQVDIGPTGSGSRGASEAAGKPRATKAPPGPGERKDGTALFNPDRAYRPDWDSKQVPGMNIPYPASANDYREGRTFAYPAASGAPVAPGDLPRPPVETGDPKASNQ